MLCRARRRRTCAHTPFGFLCGSFVDILPVMGNRIALCMCLGALLLASACGGTVTSTGGAAGSTGGAGGGDAGSAGSGNAGSGSGGDTGTPDDFSACDINTVCV